MKRVLIATLILSSLLFLAFFSQAQMLEPATLTTCEKDADCIIVPYSHCCGSTKRAINKAELSNYNAHPEWQRFDGEACAMMGACVSDKDIVAAQCLRNPGEKTGSCQFLHPTEGK